MFPVMKYINTTQAYKIIKATKGHIFSCSFIKKDGTIRDMVCRLGVKKYLKGGQLGFNPEEKGLIIVFDTAIKQYRCINVKTLMALKVDGQEYEITNK